MWAGVGLVRGGAGTALVGSHERGRRPDRGVRRLGIDEFVLSGYPHLEGAYWFGEGVLPLAERPRSWPPDRSRCAGRSARPSRPEAWRTRADPGWQRDLPHNRRRSEMPTRDTGRPAPPAGSTTARVTWAARKAFYGDLLGWTWTGGDEEYGGYSNAEKDGSQVARLGPLMNEGDSPAWTTYFATDDAAATAGRIREAGGTVVVEPMAAARWARWSSRWTAGHAFGLWQAGEHTGVQRFNEPGTLVWNEGAVDDTASAQRFYSSVSGSRGDAIGRHGLRDVPHGDRPLGGLGQVQPGLPRGCSRCASPRPRADGAAASTEAAGGKALPPAEDSPFGRFAVLEDPCGRAVLRQEVDRRLRRDASGPPAAVATGGPRMRRGSAAGAGGVHLPGLAHDRAVRDRLAASVARRGWSRAVRPGSPRTPRASSCRVFMTNGPYWRPARGSAGRRG